MEDKGIHPLVELMLARMESHPEEFTCEKFGINPMGTGGDDRWWRVRETIEGCGTEEEKAAVWAATRKITMNACHEWMLDELLNGEARRRKEWEELEAKRKAAYAMQSTQLQQQAIPQYGSQLAGTNTSINTLTDAYANIKKALGV